MDRRTVVSLPAVLATVYARRVMAQEPATPSGCASLAPSGWRARNPEVTDEQCGAVLIEPEALP
jgi:hypothetical protein